MEFTINSKQKKVELFYESTEEQKAILELVSKWVIYKENYVSSAPAYRDISWASITNVSDMANSIRANTTNLEGAVELDSLGTVLTSDIPSNCIHVTAKSR